MAAVEVVQRDESERLAAIVADLRRELATLKAATEAERAVVKTIICRHERELERFRAALVIHEEASIAAVDGVHVVARLIETLRAKVDRLVGGRTVH